MAGHSKWNNIKQRKGAQDAKRGKIFQKLSREIYVAAKEGGPDPDMNAALRLAVDRAKAENMPNDNIDRAIKKASGGEGGPDYREVIYEGYGPNGIAILVETLTDNRNRTSSNVRTAFNKGGGNLGTSGSVSYLFEHKGYIAIDRSTTDADEDTMFMEVIESGADELLTSDEAFEIYTKYEDFAQVRDALEESGYKLATAELTMEADNLVAVDAETQESLETIIDMLEDDDDVQKVYHNAQLN